MSDLRERYAQEFNEQAVRMLEEGRKTGPEIEKELGIGTGQVYRWRKALEAESRGASGPSLGTGEHVMRNLQRCAR